MDPTPNSPEDVGFIDKAKQPRTHEPKLCGSCRAKILWAAILGEGGQRIRNDDTGRFRSMPVDWEPSPHGNVVVYWREGEGFVCRTLKLDEQPREGEKLRTSHFYSCPNAPQHRKKKPKAQRCGGVLDVDPGMTCETCGTKGAFPETMMCKRCTFEGSNGQSVEPAHATKAGR
jgi:hypothetical protein